MKIIGLIPTRLNSSRLPNKALLNIQGLPLIVHVLKRAMLSKLLDEVYVCTDSKEIAQVVEQHGGKKKITKNTHVNGTERIAEAAQTLDADFYVDIQGDEPLINPHDIDAVIEAHIKNPDWEILLPSQPITATSSPNIVKLVHSVNMRVMYLSRSLIPFNFRVGSEQYLKHLSIISFKPHALEKFSKLKQTQLEQIEDIELLRALEHNFYIGTIILKGNSFSIDVKDDYLRAEIQMKDDPIFKLYSPNVKEIYEINQQF
jgi:3-deoxy-manno-octulosonate cytidylyltransferase (CMP-KDO synthetase)